MRNPSPSHRDGYIDPRMREKKDSPEEISVRRDTLVRLREALEEIISRLNNQVYWLKQATEIRCMRWRCQGCGHVESFSLPKPMETATPCPKCKGEKFEAAP